MTGFFSEFPSRYYDFDGDVHLITNITKRFVIKDEVKNNPDFYTSYMVQDSDNPVSIASKVYGDGNLFWVLFEMNNIYDYYSDWPLTQEELQKALIQKYGQEGLDDIAYWIDDFGQQVDPSLVPLADRKGVTNFEHEVAINDDKRLLKILDPRHLQSILDNYREILNEQ